MKRLKRYAALNLGGSSGRCVVGNFDGEVLSLEEVHRFPNSYVRVLGEYYWDILRIFEGAKQGLRRARGEGGGEVASIGVDTWGVAFALIDANGWLLGNPFYNRVPQRPEIIDLAFQRLPREEIFRITGRKLSRLNSLYRLLALQAAGSRLLEVAETFLMTPDLINYWLTGRKVSEHCIATTSHLIDARSGDWAWELIEAMGFPARIFPEVVASGQVLERLNAALAEETGLGRVPVVATASHDTASAVASVPARSGDFAYLSSGTWGLLGTELAAPLLTEGVFRHDFVNEGGALGTARLLDNLLNLWFVQECRRIWALEGEAHTWEDLIERAGAANSFTAFIDPADPAFLLPEHMPRELQSACRRTGQAAPSTKGGLTRLVFESLALSYRATLDKLADILGRRPGVLHIVGGGGRNRLLCQFAADACGVPVVAGPYEATWVGNIIVQMVAMGDLGDLAEARELVRRSFPTETYEPGDTQRWEEQYQGFQSMTGAKSLSAAR